MWRKEQIETRKYEIIKDNKERENEENLKRKGGENIWRRNKNEKSEEKK